MFNFEQELVDVLGVLKTKVSRAGKNKIESLTFDSEEAFRCSIAEVDYDKHVDRILEQLAREGVIINYFRYAEDESQAEEDSFDGILSPFGIAYPDDFIERCEEYVKNNITKSKDAEKVRKFDYNVVTGYFFKNGIKAGKFRDGTVEYNLMKAAYEVRGSKITRNEIIKILKLENNFSDDNKATNCSTKVDSRYKVANEVMLTAKLNIACKNIRTKTGLSTLELVNNGGNVTLVLK